MFITSIIKQTLLSSQQDQNQRQSYETHHKTPRKQYRPHKQSLHNIRSNQITKWVSLISSLTSNSTICRSLRPKSASRTSRVHSTSGTDVKAKPTLDEQHLLLPEDLVWTTRRTLAYQHHTPRCDPHTGYEGHPCMIFSAKQHYGEFG